MNATAVWHRARPVLGWLALVSAFGFAWYTWSRRPIPVQAVVLLTQTDRAHLVELRWRLSTAPGSDDQRGSLRFAKGSAPEAAGPIAMHVPHTARSRAVEVQVECVFDSGAGPVTTQATLRVGGAERQTLDLASCCDGC
ncbi:MAG: hypothetical protein FJ100_11300 [Deltaproteobacteria bacterium]|nr:hypothetical protein [Deltaproteobacteria bacterium]